MWVGKSESSSFRMGVLTDLKARGVPDTLITYTDLEIPSVPYSLSHPPKSVWYIRSEALVNMSFIRTRKSLRRI